MPSTAKRPTGRQSIGERQRLVARGLDPDTGRPLDTRLVPAEPSCRQGPLPPPAAPGGRDPVYWHLALYFQDQAAKDHIQLRTGAPVIYDEIRAAFAAFDFEGGSRIFEDDIPYARVYRDGTGARLPWEKVAEAVIDEFWTRVWDREALRYFCDLERLDETTWDVCRRWRTTRTKPVNRPVPEPITWNRPESARRKRK